MLAITPIYAGLLTIIFVALSARVSRARRSEKRALGVGESKMLLRVVRVHGNFAEYVPLALLMLLLLELQVGPQSMLHGLGIALVLGRVLHALGVSREPEDFRLRTAGMALTFTVLTASAGWLLTTV